MIPKQKRYAIAYVDSQYIVDLLNYWQAPPGSYIRVQGEGVPADALVQNVFYAPERRSFAVVLSHESFEPVPEGSAFPSLGNGLFFMVFKPTEDEPRSSTAPLSVPHIPNESKKFESSESSGDFFRRVMGE